jgi:hypothetical protein
MSSLSLRTRQIQCLQKMLTLGGSSAGGRQQGVGGGLGSADPMEDYAEQWKILVYDADSRDVLSPLMNVGALRAKGVTLHLQVCLYCVKAFQR